MPGSPVKISGANILSQRRRTDGSLYASSKTFTQTAGIPAGYKSRAVLIAPIKDGSISSFTTRPETTATLVMIVKEQMTPIANGITTTSLAAILALYRQMVAAGVTTPTVAAKTYERIKANLSIGAQPSAVDIAEAVLGGVLVEGSYNLRQLMRLLSAVLLGKSTSGNTNFKAAGNDAITRVVGTVDGSNNRTAVTLTPGD